MVYKEKSANLIGVIIYLYYESVAFDYYWE